MKARLYLLLVLITFSGPSLAWGDREQGIVTGIIASELLFDRPARIVRESRVYVEPQIYIEREEPIYIRRGPEIFYDREYRQYRYTPEYPSEYHYHRHYHRNGRR